MDTGLNIVNMRL